MAKAGNHEDRNIHIGQVDVEKIPLGQGKFLYHISDRFFINDRDRQGKKIWKEIPPGEKVFLGKDTLSFPPQVFFGNERITLSAYNLFFSKKSGKGLFGTYERILCNHISFRAEPGTLTGIMGPSGAGKTVLLNLLSGYAYSRQNTGRVFINDTYDVHQERPILGRTIGYVPQDDTLIPHLTVWDSLNYCFRLRYSGVEDELKAYIVRDACQKSGFSGERLEKLLPTRIGSPDDKTLSGGERKRVNIAHELIRNPLLLFLDEPTSGLSSVDADNVIASLKELCQKTHITIVLTIHQPSMESFEKLDRLLVVNQGGNIAYFGAAQDAVPYFEEKAQTPYKEHQNPAEFILKALHSWTFDLKESGNNEQAPEEIIYDMYKKDPHYFPYVITEQVLADLKTEGVSEEILKKLQRIKAQKFLWRREFLNTLKKTIGNEYTTEAGVILRYVLKSGDSQQLSHVRHEKIQEIPQLSTSFFQQFWVLLRRNQTAARADKKNKLFQLLQPVAIAVLMLIAFSWYTQDYSDEDIFARVGYYFTQQLANKGQIYVQQDMSKAKKLAYSQKTLLGEGSANRRAAVSFLLIASCIWFGVINSCKEIVDERAVLKREAKSILKISSYLVAKVVFLGWICFKQTLLLLAIVFLPNLLLTGEQWFPDAWILVKTFLLSLQLLPDIGLSYAAGMFAILFVTAVLASWLGLFISALAPTQKTALTVVPLVIIPQLLFGGLIRPVKDMGKSENLMLTQEAFTQLNLEVPKEILKQLQALKDQPFTEEKQFVSEVRALIGNKPTAQFKELLVHHAKIKGFCEKLALLPFHLHDLMLQKWSFKAILLYNSLDQPTVLKKQVDLDRYREYEYLQFEPIYTIEMFFDVNLHESSGEAKKSLYQTVSGMIVIHAVLLLILNYFWLRRKLRYY